MNLEIEFVAITCCHEGCGIVWAVPVDYKKERKKDHDLFYCPNGHGQHYTRRSKEEELRENLQWCRTSRDSWREEAETLERSRRSLKGHLTRMKNKEQAA